MARLHSVLAALVVILAPIAALMVPRTASAQLPSLWAVKLISLEPARGAERVAKDLASYLRAHNALVVDSSEVPPDARARFARCIVRDDLPKPRPLALECFDYAGAFVGTLRAKNARQLWGDGLMSYLYQGGPTARPLTEYRSVYIEPLADDPYDAKAYVADLLRKDKRYRVVESLEAVPADQKRELLRCLVKPAFAFSGPMLLPTMISALEFKGAAGEQVFYFTGSAKFYIRVAEGVRKSLTSAVHELLRAREADQEIYARGSGAKANDRDSRR